MQIFEAKTTMPMAPMPCLARQSWDGLHAATMLRRAVLGILLTRETARLDAAQ
jgi:hypothetical protein